MQWAGGWSELWLRIPAWWVLVEQQVSVSQAVQLLLQPIPFFYVGGISQGAGLGQGEQASKHQGEEEQELFVETCVFWRR